MSASEPQHAGEVVLGFAALTPTYGLPMLTCAKLITERVRGWEWFAHIVQR